ncbi:MAG TPA: amino acid ABC transporter permease [Actinomycetes bacterium]|nr:amino acid ABC transporter permease [Actinomycetes bacterium]
MTTSVLYDVPGPRSRRRIAIWSAVATVVVAGLFALVIWQLQRKGQFDAEKWEPFTDPGIQRGLLRALAATLRAAVFAIILALIWGALLCIGRLSEHRWLRYPAGLVIEFFRAVPLVLLILFVFFGFTDWFDNLGETLEDTLPPFLANLLAVDQWGTLGPLVIALMLYNGAVLAEIFRAGIHAVPRGQAEAAYALGLRKSQVMRLILIPQATRIMLPAIVSQSVVVLKDTALGYIIAYLELVRQGQLIYNQYRNIIPSAIVVATIYITLNVSLSRIATWLEARQSRRYGRQAVAAAEAAVPEGSIA